MSEQLSLMRAAIYGGLGGTMSVVFLQMGTCRQAPLEQSKRPEQSESAGVVVSAISAPMLQATPAARP